MKDKTKILLTLSLIALSSWAAAAGITLDVVSPTGSLTENKPDTVIVAYYCSLGQLDAGATLTYTAGSVSNTITLGACNCKMTNPCGGTSFSITPPVGSSTTDLRISISGTVTTTFPAQTTPVSGSTVKAIDSAISCGDGTCSPGETCTDPKDAAACPAVPPCYTKACAGGCGQKAISSYTQDTGRCDVSSGSCADTAGNTGPPCMCIAGVCSVMCNNNGMCDIGETAADCPAETCGAACDNDGNCEPGETNVNCIADCHCGAPPAGDGVCKSPETASSCNTDCGGSPTTGPKPITINSLETCPDGPTAGRLQKNTLYSMKIRYTTTTAPLEDLKAYYCVSPPYPAGSGSCKSGTSICPMTNQLACAAGECNPGNCSVAGSCTCEAKIQIPFAAPTAGITLAGVNSAGVEQYTVTPVNYEVIAPIVEATEDMPETQLLVYGGYQTLRCGNVGSGFPGCAYDFSCTAATEANPLVRCRDCNDCKIKCAQACGEHTTCVGTAGQTCEGCCDSTTCGNMNSVAYDESSCLLTPCYISVQESCACKQACRGECKSHTGFCNTINLLRTVAGILTAIMLVVQALRYVLSDDPLDRQNAKEGIWYVLIGATLILLASALVGYFMGGRIC